MKKIELTAFMFNLTFIKFLNFDKGTGDVFFKNIFLDEIDVEFFNQIDFIVI